MTEPFGISPFCHNLVRMRLKLIPFLLLGLVVDLAHCGRTGKVVIPDPNAAASDEGEADPPGADVDDGSATSEYVDRSRKRSPSVRGIPSRRNSGRAVKQKVDYEDMDAELDVLLAQEGEASSCSSDDSDGLGPGPSPKVRRARFEFPPKLRAPKAGRPRFVTMTMPERLAPKTLTHTVAQEYAWACNFVGDRRRVKDGSASGSWARLVEVLAGAKSAIMQEANRDMRMMDLTARRELAEERSEHRLRRVRDAFVGRTMTQMEVSRATALQMWEPACLVLKAKHKAWIEEDIAELEELILEAEEWRVAPSNATCGPACSRADRGDEDDADGGGTGGPGLSSLANAPFASVGP